MGGAVIQAPTPGISLHNWPVLFLLLLLKVKRQEESNVGAPSPLGIMIPWYGMAYQVPSHPICSSRQLCYDSHFTDEDTEAQQERGHVASQA